jgi:hypothetical protein
VQRLPCFQYLLSSLRALQSCRHRCVQCLAMQRLAVVDPSSGQTPAIFFTVIIGSSVVVHCLHFLGLFTWVSLLGFCLVYQLQTLPSSSSPSSLSCDRRRHCLPTSVGSISCFHRLLPSVASIGCFHRLLPSVASIGCFHHPHRRRVLAYRRRAIDCRCFPGLLPSVAIGCRVASVLWPFSIAL